jgi:hypothetical protein
VEESPRDLVREAERGASDRTPALALTGVIVAVAAVVLAIMAIALILYFVFE